MKFHGFFQDFSGFFQDFPRIFKSFLFFFFSQKSFFFFFFSGEEDFFSRKKKKKKRSFPTREKSPRFLRKKLALQAVAVIVGADVHVSCRQTSSIRDI